MGLTFIKASIINPENPRRKTRLEFLVDSGATYSVAPKTRLNRIGIRPHGTRTFTLADGTRMTGKSGLRSFPSMESKQHLRSFSASLGTACFLAPFPSKR